MNDPIDHKKLAVIHITKKELALSDDEYRDILFNATGVRSAKELTNEQFRKLMNYFVRTKHYRERPDGITLRQKLFIKTLFETLGWDESHRANFIQKYYHTSNLNQLDKKNASRLIESLKHIKNNTRQNF